MTRSSVTHRRIPNHLIFDSFDRADSTNNLGTTDGKTDGRGTLEPLTWTQQSGTWGILTKRGYMSAGGGASRYATVDLSLADMDLTLRPAQTGGGQIGIVFRYTDTTHFWRFIDNGGAMQLEKQNVTNTVVATGSHTRTNGDVIRVIAVGSAINCYVNSVLLASTTDSFNSTATKCGLNMVTNNTVVNNFSARTP